MLAAVISRFTKGSVALYERWFFENRWGKAPTLLSSGARKPKMGKMAGKWVKLVGFLLLTPTFFGGYNDAWS